ncbi:hypothetical protein ABH922_003461 [Rhodococcus sp. 27YEA15]|uniref:hypothetical protein n=1 Tax=Rhodococcus sp. 27YEA15 TaxID=3156259 RepID=UPI003C7D69A3
MTDDNQQISVAELLKRNGQSVESRGGRRRRGVAGGISVAELTGEIPVVRSVGSRAAADNDADAAEPTDTDPADNEAADNEAADNEAADTEAADTEAAGTEPATGTVATDLGDDEVSPTRADTAKNAKAAAETESAATAAPAARVPADRTAAFSVVLDADDDADDDDDDTDDVDDADDGESASTPDTADKTGSTSVPSEETKTSKSAPGQWVSRTPLSGAARPQVRQEPALLSGQTLAGDLMRQERAAAQSPAMRPPVLPPRIPAAPVPATAAEDSTEMMDKIAGPKQTDAVDLFKEPDTDLFKEPDIASEEPADTTAEPTRPVTARDTAEDTGERSSIREWAVLAGQVVLALVVGGAMFKGFEKLWDMLPWVALVLALIVIVGLVAVVRVLRKTDDITSFVIAVVVGMIVTLGPLAFLLASG